tara:strand:- start:680 stop:1036 length:357 start_codon:yes stop_codon:yes gene_type:complete
MENNVYICDNETNKNRAIMTNAQLSNEVNEAAILIINNLTKAGYNFYIDKNQSIIEVDISSTRIVSVELPQTELIQNGIPQGICETNVFDWNGNLIASSTSPFIAFRKFNKWALALVA